MSTSAGTEIKHNKHLVPVSTILRFLTEKDGDQSSYFEKIDATEASFANSTLKHLLIDSHSNDDNTGNIRANLTIEHIFGFYETFKKIAKCLCFELQLKASDEKQIIMYTTLRGNDANLTKTSMYLFIPSLVPSPEQKQIFNESITQSFTLSFD